MQQAIVFFLRQGGRRYGMLGWNGTFIAIAGDPGMIGELDERQSLNELSVMRAFDVYSSWGCFRPFWHMWE